MNKQDNKNMFLNNFDFMVKSLMHNSCLGIPPKYLIFRNAPKSIIDLCVLIDCTYPLDYLACS